MLKTFNLLYYVPGLTDVGLDDWEWSYRERFYKLLQKRKAEESAPKKKD